MSEAASERFTELVGPLVVKEVRQGLRGRVFAIFFGVLLTACFFVALFAWGSATDGMSGRQGRETLALFLAAQGAVCFFIIPFTAFRSMMKELEDETWVLLTLTGLGSRPITRGKWLSAMSQSALYASACAPFVLFSYFLNGVDIPQITASLVLTAGWSAVLTSAAVAIAANAHGRFARVIALFVTLGVLLAGSAMGIGFLVALSEEGQRMLTRDAPKNFILGAFVFSWALTWLGLEVAGAGLAAPSEHASKWPRRALVTVTTLGIAFGAAVFIDAHGSRQDGAVGQILTCFFIALAGGAAMAEADGWPRELRDSARLKPGALRTYWMMLGLLALSSVTWVALELSVGDSGGKYLRSVFATPLYPALYWSLGVLVSRLTPLRKIPMAGVAGFLLSIVVGVAFSILAALLFTGRPDHRVVNALNPFIGVFNFIDHGSSDMNTAVVLLGCATLLAIFCAHVVLWSRDEVRR